MTVDLEKNKRVVRDIFEKGWNYQKFGSFSEAIGESAVFNFRSARQITNLQQLKELIAFWKNAFPDLQFKVIDVIAENDLVAANLVFTGTHLGPWFGIPPKGNQIRVEEMMFFRFDGQQLIEMWEVYDEVVMRQQIEATDPV